MLLLANLLAVAAFLAHSVLGAQKDRIASAWYAGWHADAGYPLSSVSWDLYTHQTFSFAETTPDVNFLSLNGSNPEILPQFVEAAHKNGVKALVSVGGWTGSRWFSSNVGSADNRTAFVKTITTFASQHKLDGIDFDWEYPGNQGIGCNIVAPNDTDNFLAFLQELRKTKAGSKLILSAAVAGRPFIGSTGSPISDASGFAKVLDYVQIMNYDVWGPWSPTVGPNAPLNDTCAAPSNQGASAVLAVKLWNEAGIPYDQIVLGVPAYGHSFSVLKANAFIPGTLKLALYPSFNSSDRPAGDAWDDAAGFDECGAPQAPGGNIDFWGLIDAGYLSKSGHPVSTIPYTFDECSQTPYVYNPETEIMVSFDNAQSFAAKGKFIGDTGIRGFAMWESGGDKSNILLKSIRKAAGFH
ncbi:endochitinase [Mycena floridula]|nr:endochitinase [Mycena floridula]